MEYCLGLEILGQCNYDPLRPEHIYFSLGQLAVTTVLLLVFSQLVSPIIWFRFRTKLIGERITISMFMLGAISILLANTVPFIYFLHLPVIGYPIFWEFLGTLLFLCGVLSLTFTSKASMFNQFNYAQYFEQSVIIIETGTNKELKMFAEEISASIDNIISACKAYDINTSVENLNDYTRYALSLLNLFSDQRLCNIMIESTPQTAIKLFSSINEHSLYHSGGKSLVKNILEAAFKNRASVLYAASDERENDYFGIYDKNKFISTSFGNYKFLNSHFNPFGAWRVLEDQHLEICKVKIYVYVMRVSLTVYLEEGEFEKFSMPLRRGFMTLEDICKRESLELEKYKEQNVTFSVPYGNLTLIFTELQQFISLIEDNSGRFYDIQISPAEYRIETDNTIFALFAQNLHNILLALSVNSHLDNTYRELLRRLWDRLFPINAANDSISIGQAIRIRLNIYLLRTLRSNLLDGTYPMLLRLMLNITGLPNEKSSENSPRLKLQRTLGELVSENLGEFLLKYPNKINEVLPERIVYKKSSLIEMLPSGDVVLKIM